MNIEVNGHDWEYSVNDEWSYSVPSKYIYSSVYCKYKDNHITVHKLDMEALCDNDVTDDIPILVKHGLDLIKREDAKWIQT